MKEYHKETRGGRTIQGPLVSDLLDFRLDSKHPGLEPNKDRIGREES